MSARSTLRARIPLQLQLSGDRSSDDLPTTEDRKLFHDQLRPVTFRLFEGEWFVAIRQLTSDNDNFYSPPLAEALEFETNLGRKAEFLAPKCNAYSDPAGSAPDWVGRKTVEGRVTSGTREIVDWRLERMGEPETGGGEWRLVEVVEREVRRISNYVQ